MAKITLDAAGSPSIAVAFHGAVLTVPKSRDHALRLTQRKYVASRRTRRERARRIRPFGFVIFDLEIDRFLHYAKTRDFEVENDEKTQGR